MAPSPYSVDLDKNNANYTPLSPLTFIERAAAVYPDRCAIVYRDYRQSWRQTYTRCRQLASALCRHGIGVDDTVALMLPNVPAMCEAHFAVPMAGGVIHGLNIRLDADQIAFQLRHGQAKVLLTDREFSTTIEAVLQQLDEKPLVIDVDDPSLLLTLSSDCCCCIMSALQLSFSSSSSTKSSST